MGCLLLPRKKKIKNRFFLGLFLFLLGLLVLLLLLEEGRRPQPGLLLLLLWGERLGPRVRRAGGVALALGEGPVAVRLLAVVRA